MDRRAGGSSASSPRSATTWPTDECRRGRSTRISSMISPPRPTMAAAIESTSMSRARTVAPSGIGETSGDGRPGVPRGAARVSDTSPLAASSPMRPRIALRVRPVRATSSDRERAPRVCSSRRITLRFARRTVSLRCPSSSRRFNTLGLCSFLPKVCDTLVHGGRGVKMRARGTGPAMSTLRWGILSTADIARNKVIPGLRKAARCEIVAIASRDDRRAGGGGSRAGHPASPRLVRGAPGRP